MVMTVSLTAQNIKTAGDIGIQRRIMGMSKKGVNNIDQLRMGWQADIEGAIAEMAVAKAFGIYWDGGKMGDLTQKDVDKYQVRSTTYKNGCLLMTDRDHDNDMYILLLSYQQPNYTLAGWIYGREGMRKEYIRKPNEDRGACYFIPQDKLRSMDELLRLRSRR